MYGVTRQSYWPDGDNIVEIASEGLEYANPDALCARYAGEFEDYADPREAAEVAISICEAWNRDDPDAHAEVAHGCTLGFTMPFKASPTTAVRAWAKKAWEALPKCDGCGDPLPPERERWSANDWDGLEYCSEECAQRAAEAEQEALAIDDGDED